MLYFLGVDPNFKYKIVFITLDFVINANISILIMFTFNHLSWENLNTIIMTIFQNFIVADFRVYYAGQMYFSY